MPETWPPLKLATELLARETEKVALLQEGISPLPGMPPLRLITDLLVRERVDASLLLDDIHKLDAENKQTAVCDLLKNAGTLYASIDEANEIYFYRAQCASSSGNLPEAAEAYEAILRTRPEAGRIWLEYAKLLVQLGRTSEALAAFSSVMKNDPPENVRSFVMEQMASLSGKNWDMPFGRGRLTVGYISDSNISASTSAREIALRGQIFVLDSSPLADHGMQYSGNYSLTLLEEGRQWYGDLSGSITRYSTYHDYNQSLFSVSGGIRIPYGPFLVEAPIHADYMHLGGKLFRVSGGVAPKVFWNPQSSDWIMSLGAVLDGQRYPTQPGKDGTQQALSAGLKKMSVIDKPDYVEAEISKSRNKAESGEYGASNRMAALRYYYAGQDASFSAEYQKTFSNYDVPDPWSGDDRREVGQYVSASIMHACFGFICSLGVAHQQNRSTIPLYSYEKRLFTLHANYVF